MDGVIQSRSSLSTFLVTSSCGSESHFINCILDQDYLLVPGNLLHFARYILGTSHTFRRRKNPKQMAFFSVMQVFEFFCLEDFFFLADPFPWLQYASLAMGYTSTSMPSRWNCIKSEYKQQNTDVYNQSDHNQSSYTLSQFFSHRVLFPNRIKNLEMVRFLRNV